MQARQSDVHPSVFKRSHLGSMKAREISKFVLGPAAFPPQSSDSHTQAPLNLLALQYEQFRGNLLKRILLISRDNRESAFHRRPPKRSERISDFRGVNNGTTPW